MSNCIPSNIDRTFYMRECINAQVDLLHLIELSNSFDCSFGCFI